MNGLAVCAGVGGIELGLSLAKKGYQTICHIEREAYAVAILRTRMEEKAIHEAPIWDDVKTFDGKPWRGKVDIITAGFPCQPWSQAGKRQGTEDERWIWPDIARIIGEVRPRYVFLENVPGLVSGSGLLEVLGDLAKIGYDAEWMHLSAAAVGANHKRERVWILAYNPYSRDRHERSLEEMEGRKNTEPPRVCEYVAYSNGNGTKRNKSKHRKGGGTMESCHSVANAPGAGNGTPEDGKITGNGAQQQARGCGCVEGDVAYTDTERESQQERGIPDVRGRIGNGGEDVEDTRHRSGGDIRTLEEGNNSQGKRPADNSEIIGSGWWAVEPPLGRVVNELPYRVDRLRACGNGVVPLVAATAYSILRRRIGGF